jgi:hypothetical protein
MTNQGSQLHYYENPDNDYETKKGALRRAPNRAFKRKSSIIRKELGGGTILVSLRLAQDQAF